MAGSRFQVNKAHKRRFASKASLKIHRTSQKDRNRISKANLRGKGKETHAAQLQRNKMKHAAALLKEKRATSGTLSPPRVIVLFGLSACINVHLLARDLLALLSPEGTKSASKTVASPDYKLRITVLEAPHGDIESCMSMAKVADLIACVTSARLCEESDTGSFIDSFGSQCLSLFRSLGLPISTVLIRDLPEDRRRQKYFKKLCSLHSAQFPKDCKFYPAGTKEELQKFMRNFKEQRLSVPEWRSHRPFLMVDKLNLVAEDRNPGKVTLLLAGYVRACSFSVNQLVHISGAGDFEISKMDILKDPVPLSERKGLDTMDYDATLVIRTLLPDPLKKEPLIVEKIPDPLAGEQTWPTEAEMAEADKVNNKRALKKRSLPRGTSDYQAAWFVENSEDDESNDDESDIMELDDRQNEGFAGEGNAYSAIEDDQCSLSFSMRDFDEETEADTTMTDAENLTRKQIEDEIRNIKKAHADDEEFPDEVETPLDVVARRRFAKYRGLKSFRTSSWDPKESLPSDYAKIFEFDNFERTKANVFAKALAMDGEGTDECVPGTYIRLHIERVSVDVASKLLALSRTSPVLVCGLLQHESKMSVLHFCIKKHDTYDAPIKSKDMLLFHVGFRQFIARPIFSSDDIKSNNHKLERFLHTGRFSIASVYAPISFHCPPVIVLKCGHGEAGTPAIAAMGSLRSIDPDRIILKKIILTGYPQRVSKLKATVRFMFHNPEDVRWFKPVEVWTKCGRRGRIKEPVGTHGYMKCVFNGVVQQHDTVCMSLYKRAYPKWTDHLNPIMDA